MMLMRRPGTMVQIGRELARGGEGRVCEIVGHPDNVVKLYDTPLSGERAAKLRAMLTLSGFRPLDAAWPSDLIEVNGRVVGLLMPRISERHDLHEILTSSSRRRMFPDADYRMLIATAANIARAVAGVHAAGLVIGDINERFAMVGADATVRLVDCDSYQIVVGETLFSCDVGTPMYQPPELQETYTFRGLVRKRNHDTFGLAVLIFQLLFLGRHPFAGRPISGEAPELPEAIRTFQFAWGGELGLQQPPNTLSLSNVGMAAEAYFRRAFGPEGESKGRPRADAWAAKLDELRNTLSRCKANIRHWHLSDICPICRIEGMTGASFFVPSIVLSTSLYNPEREADTLWADIDAVTTPSVPQVPQNLTVFSTGIIAIPYPPRPTRGWVGGLLQSIGLLGAPDDDGEHARRTTSRDVARSAYGRLLEKYNAHDPTTAFNHKKADLNRIRHELRTLFADRQSATQALQNQLGLQRFLDSFGLARAGLKGFGQTLLSTLSAYGIGSAADVSAASLSSIPGIGPKRKKALQDWRAHLELAYKPIDGKTALNTAQIRQIEDRFDKAVKTRIMVLRSGVTDLQSLVDQEHARAHQALERLRVAARAVAQAEANLQASLGP